MSDMYPDSLSEQEIKDAAQELVLKYGENALAEAQKEINISNARGNFTLSGSWVRVCQRIRQLHVVNGYGAAVNENVTLSE